MRIAVLNFALVERIWSLLVVLLQVQVFVHRVRFVADRGLGPWINHSFLWLDIIIGGFDNRSVPILSFS